MKNMKVKSKLVLAFIIVAVMAAMVGVTGIVGLNMMNSNEDTMYGQAVTTNNATLSRRHIQAQRAALRGAALKQLLGMEYESEFDTLNTLSTEFDSQITMLKGSLKLQVNLDRLAQVEKAYAEYLTLRYSFITAVRAGNEEAIAEIMTEIGVPLDTVVTNLEAIANSALQVVSEKNTSDSRTAAILIILMIALLVIAVAVAIFFAFYISRLISKPLLAMKATMEQIGHTGSLDLSEETKKSLQAYSQYKDEIAQSILASIKTVQHFEKASAVLQRVADGDLTSDIALLSNQDTMGLSLNKMIDSLNSMFGEINASAAQVSTGSKQIADGAQSLAQGSTEQASATEELSASISEIAEKTKQNANIAREAAELSSDIRSSAEKGSVQMDQMMQAVKEINDASNQIEKVIKVIDDIAFQTNILALNAAVEAARAGQHGKGFAVVAEEVRNLAAKSAAAAKDTGGLLENSIAKATLGLQIATETSASLNEIVTGINHSAEIVEQIARSSEEQSEAIMQVNTGIDQVAQVVQQNSATAEESAAASEEMSSQSDMLAQLISNFKLKDQDNNQYLSSGY